MKNGFWFLSLLVATFMFNACDKEEDGDNNGTDLTTSIVGHYTHSSNNTDIVVNKVDNTTVSITLDTGSGSGAYDVAFSSATMNSANAFTLNTVTQNGAVCSGDETFSGTGTHSGNNISLFMTVVRTGGSTCTNGTYTRNVSAPK
ncbi:MAG: hypothetical protein SH857_04635 [Chitinophagales bacterium]|nr:hypothetical protein [Chitinophagales bacterium]